MDLMDLMGRPFRRGEDGEGLMMTGKRCLPNPSKGIACTRE